MSIFLKSLKNDIQQNPLAAVVVVCVVLQTRHIIRHLVR